MKTHLNEDASEIKTCKMPLNDIPEDFVGIIQGNVDVEHDAISHKTPIACLEYNTTP